MVQDVREEKVTLTVMQFSGRQVERARGGMAKEDGGSDVFVMKGLEELEIEDWRRSVMELATRQRFPNAVTPISVLSVLVSNLRRMSPVISCSVDLIELLRSRQ